MRYGWPISILITQKNRWHLFHHDPRIAPDSLPRSGIRKLRPVPLLMPRSPVVQAARQSCTSLASIFYMHSVACRQQMLIASLFSGCGGLDYGLHLAGHEVILLCESDPGAQQVMPHRAPPSPAQPVPPRRVALDTQLHAL